MSLAAVPFAFLMPSYGELMIILVIGLLLFGRNLPQVGKAVGKTIIEFKRGLNDLRQQIDRDEDVREIRATLTDMRDEVRKVGDATRIPTLAVPTDPKSAFERLTDPDLASPGPDAYYTPPPPEQGPFEQAAAEATTQGPATASTDSEPDTTAVPPRAPGLPGTVDRGPTTSS